MHKYTNAFQQQRQVKRKQTAGQTISTKYIFFSFEKPNNKQNNKGHGYKETTSTIQMY